jgi:hypothetical protein
MKNFFYNSCTQSEKGGEVNLARFQTHLASLLEALTGPTPEFASVSWRKLGDHIGVSADTVRAWHEAAVGSDQYLNKLDGNVLGKIMNYFDVGFDDLVVVLADDDEESPEHFQKAVIAALSAA